MNGWRENIQNIMRKCSFTQNYSEPKTPDTAGKSEVFYVFVISGVIGFLAALLGRVVWQVSVESAQVVSGIVQYTDKSPFYLYHTKVWSLLVQLPAFFLYLGVTERMLSIIISGLAGAFSFQALSLIIYAISDKKLLAVLSPMFIYITGATSVFEGSYPIYLMNSTHTYGMIGLSFSILSLALVSFRANKIGWILIGIAPAVHPIVGIITLLGAVIAVVWEKHFSYLKTILPYLVSGMLLAVLSYLYQVVAMYDVSTVDNGVSEKYVTAFIQYWDTHRARIPLLSRSILINAIVISLSFVAYNKLPKCVQYSGKFLLRAFSIIGILGIFFAIFGEILIGYLPVAFMPSRLLNFVAFGAPALLIGLLAVQEKTIRSKFLLVMMIVIPLIWYGVKRNMDIVNPLIIFIVVALIVLMLKSNAKCLSDEMIKRNQCILSVKHNLSVLLNIVVVLILSIVLAAGLIKGVLQVKERYSELRDWTNDRVYNEASKAKGVLLTALELKLVQLRTRRPVLLDAINQIPYVPESAEPINNILQKIYGINLLAPPDSNSGAVQSAGLSVNRNRTVWEKRTYDEWVEIAHEFNVSDVLTYKDWKLNLPMVASNDLISLYRIVQ